MPSLYIHIPFCRQACHYCDFHFSTLLQYMEPFLKALESEIESRKDYLQDKTISSVYFGGGTPSLLSQNEILEIFKVLNKHYIIEENAEITLEANPEDLDKDTLYMLKSTPVNRLSIGIQSFAEQDLQFMNRLHTAKKAQDSVKLAQDSGFDNISVDLIYGTQTLTNENWESNLAKTFSLNVQHISAYCLTVEKQTALHSFISMNKVAPLNNEKNVIQFEILVREMKETGFTQYEISNFSKPGFISRHNSNYWLKGNYIGLGPSAHSFDGKSRQWNVANNQAYIKALSEKQPFFEKEILSVDNQYNEYVLTSMRTIWGASLEYIHDKFGKPYADYFSKEMKKYVSDGSVVQKSNTLVLTEKGKLFADKIASDLFKVN